MTEELTLPIVIGKKYVRRDGAVVEAKGQYGLPSLAYVGTRNDIDSSRGAEWVYLTSGRAKTWRPHTLGDETPLDIVADYAEPAAAEPSPYAQVLRWIADGKAVGWQEPSGKWQSQPAGMTLAEIGAGTYSPERYCLEPPKPRTIMVNGFEVLAGEVEAPVPGARLYLPSVDSEEWCAGPFRFADAAWGHRGLQRGIVYLDRDAAIARAKAMLGIDPKS